MSESLTLHLHNRQQARQVITDRLFPYLAQELQADRKLVLTVKPATRSSEQNAALHAAITDIAKQCEWAGRKWDVEAWKRLICAAWCRAESQGVEMVPAIDGAGFDVLYKRTSKLTIKECSSLLEYVYAWGSEQGCKFTAPQWMEDER